MRCPWRRSSVASLRSLRQTRYREMYGPDLREKVNNGIAGESEVAPERQVCGRHTGPEVEEVPRAGVQLGTRGSGWCWPCRDFETRSVGRGLWLIRTAVWSPDPAASREERALRMLWRPLRVSMQQYYSKCSPGKPCRPMPWDGFYFCEQPNQEKSHSLPGPAARQKPLPVL